MNSSLHKEIREMAKSFQLMALVLFGFVAVAAAEVVPVAPEDRPGDRDAIRAHIDSIFKAYIEKDRDTVRATHAAEWRGFLRVSRSIIRGIDEYMKAAEPSLASAGGVTDYEMLEFDVLFYGDMALVSYVAKLENQPAIYQWKIRVLDIYAKQDGHWIQVASNTDLHPDSQAALRQQPNPLVVRERPHLLAAREAVWRAWYTDDRAHLAKVIPPETITIDAEGEEWADRDTVLRGAQQFEESGAQLVDLDFPRTEIQLYGDVAILYTLYKYTVEKNGQRQSQSGRGTEVFVKRAGQWVNVGWHLDSGVGSAP
jgi:ketosteroid isomerase-like protein